MKNNKQVRRTSTASLALISEVRDGEIKYLSQWNGRWRKFSFVGGHIEQNESPRDCLRREVKEELTLVEGRNFELLVEEPICLEHDAWSEGAREDTHYTMYVFRLNLRDQASRDIIDAKPENRWLSITEIQAERTSDGKPVSQTMARLLDNGILGASLV